MSNLSSRRFLQVFGVIFLLAACSCNAAGRLDRPENAEDGNVTALLTSRFRGSEYDLVEIPLPEELAAAQMEYSGLAWYRQELILLPQYPNGISGDREGQLFAVSADNLLEYLTEGNIDITVRLIPFDDGGLSEKLDGFEGFESLVFIGDFIYLTIETHGGNPMKAFVVKGMLKTSASLINAVVLDGASLTELPVQNSSRNASYEALTTDGQYIYALYEQNGVKQNPAPFAIRLDADLNNYQEIPMDALNYRLTDATVMDQEGIFWVMNYFFPGDSHLAVKQDPLAARYGLGESHHLSEPVERLVKFRSTSERIELLDEAPLYLSLLDNGDARNWEGLANLGDLGFLLITDSFPESIFGFLAFK